MNIKDIDLNLMAVFSAIYAEKNISKAAERLGISQPATSNALARLRKTLDDPLFVRNGKGVTPTARAIDLIEPVEKALDLIQTSLNKKSDFNFSQERRTFNVAMSDYSEYMLLPRVLNWMAEFAPSLQINVWPIEGSNLADGFERGKLDLAIGYIPTLSEGFHKQRLFNESFLSIMRADHPAAKEELSMQDFLAYPHISLTPRTHQGSNVDLALKPLKLERHVALQVPNYLTVPAIVAKSDHIATVPARIAYAFADLFRLKVCTPPVALEPVAANQYWHQTMNNEPGVKWLRRFLYDMCQRM